MSPQDTAPGYKSGDFKDFKSEVSSDVHEQVRVLREQLDTLMRERVRPMVADAADIAQNAATKARAAAEDQIDAVSGKVSDNPLTSIIIAAIAGYLFGRFSR
jgi:ElaB/YqjD/DUF883 family membrane-anchored ribosome-binding protein